MVKKIVLCLLSVMLCLTTIISHFNDVKANGEFYPYDQYDGETIRMTVGSHIYVETIGFDYESDEEVEYQFKLNNDHVSVDQDGKVVGKSAGETVLTAYYTLNGKYVEYKMTFHVTDPVLKKTKYTVYSRDDYGSLCKVYVDGLEKSSEIYVWDGDLWINDINYTKGYIEFYIDTSCKATLIIDGKEFEIEFKIVKVELNTSNRITKYLGSLVTYSGKSDNLTLKLDGKKAKPKSWKSMKTSVATVNKDGKVTGKGLGRTYIRANLDNGDYIDCLVECTYKKAYQAVSNGFKDMIDGYNKKPIQYSQSKRMSKGYRDCSSFVSRCYYDTTLGRKIYKIGSIKGNYASTAADQAKWLYQKGKTVANGWVSEDKLLPGDTIYTCGDTNNGRWRKIYHATLYVGNGIVITTGSSSSKGATLMLRYYDYNGSNIKFIGRPLKSSKTIKTTSLSLNKTSLTLGVKEKYTLKATRKPTNSTEKVTWSSSKSSIASVSSSGVITAKKSGTVYITAKSGSKTKKCKVVVKKAPSSIKLNAKTKTLKVKQTYQLNVTLSSGSASYKKTYTSSNSKVATVSSSGKITAKKKGKAMITVKTYNGKKATINITVK